MKRTVFFIVIFAIAFTVFFFGPPLLGIEFGLYPLVKVADVFDLLTPLVLIPLYWLLYSAEKKEMKLSHVILFLVFAALWVEGQGMHLSANSIGHLLEGVKGSNAYRLTYFYDEILSHYLWHLGVMSLSVLLVFREWQNPSANEKMPLLPVIVAGIIHGFTFFSIVIEGGTAPLGIPFVLLAVVFGLVRGRKRLGKQPLATLFFVSYVVAMVFFIGWGVYWKGLPQFSEVGII